MASVFLISYISLGCDEYPTPLSTVWNKRTMTTVEEEPDHMIP